MSNIWAALSRVDVSDKVEKKGNLSYLSWAWAWGKVKEFYPAAVYEVRDNVQYADGSVEVWVTVKIEDQVHSMWLPVMDNRNNAVKNPDARKISDARMRCLVKCLAMFGLGHYIYAGEDLPMDDGEEYAGYRAKMDADSYGFMVWFKSQSEEVQINIANCASQGEKTKWKQLIRDAETGYNSAMDATADAIEDVTIEGGSDSLLSEALDELTTDEKRLLWPRLSKASQERIRKLTKG